jgi:hypothetical protein
MTIFTLAKFLIGNRQAILDIAASKHAIWLGLLFVLSTGFAREYDGEDLLHEPWQLLIPLAASSATSVLLYCVLWIVLRGWSTFPNEWRTFQSFVALYWMTAPLAWIYAIPVERFLSPAEATAVNLLLLAVVAVWRVLLIIQVIAVIFRAPSLQVAFPVLLFANTVLIALTILVPVPIFAIMGGIRLSESEELMMGVTLVALLISQYTWIFFGFCTLGSVFLFDPRERVPSFGSMVNLPVRRPAWLLAAGSLLIWLFVLPWTQPEQQHRRHVDELMKSGKATAALTYMSQLQMRDFPPHWDPPPRLGYPGQRPSTDALIDAFTSGEWSPWVTEEYFRKFDDQFNERDHYRGFSLVEVSEKSLQQYREYQERIRAAAGKMD